MDDGPLRWLPRGGSFDEKFKKREVGKIKEHFPESEKGHEVNKMYVTRCVFFTRSVEYKEKSVSHFFQLNDLWLES